MESASRADFVELECGVHEARVALELCPLCERARAATLKELAVLAAQLGSESRRTRKAQRLERNRAEIQKRKERLERGETEPKPVRRASAPVILPRSTASSVPTPERVVIPQKRSTSSPSPSHKELATMSDTKKRIQLDETQKANVVLMYQNKHSISAIGRTYGVNQSTIRGILKHAGVLGTSEDAAAKVAEWLKSEGAPRTTAEFVAACGRGYAMCLPLLVALGHLRPTPEAAKTRSKIATLEDENARLRAELERLRNGGAS